MARPVRKAIPVQSARLVLKEFKVKLVRKDQSV